MSGRGHWGPAGSMARGYGIRRTQYRRYTPEEIAQIGRCQSEPARRLLLGCSEKYSVIELEIAAQTERERQKLLKAAAKASRRP